MTRPAYRVDGSEVHRDEFYRHACDPQRSVLVEACAGAGKTWILVSRILRALLEGARPHEILAITFTRKAAGEMQERLSQWLREFADPQMPPDRKIAELMARGVAPHSAAQLAPQLAQLNAKLLDEARAVQIQTFHAWFAQLLRSSPSELLDEIGLRSDMELIERIDDHQAAVWRRFHGAVRRDAVCLQDFDELCARRGRARLRTWLEATLERRVEIERADRAGVLEASVPPPWIVWPELQVDQDPVQTLHAPNWRVALRDLAGQLGRGGIRASGASQRLTLALAQEEGRGVFDAAWNALFTASGTPRKDLGQVPGLVDVQVRLERLAAQLNQHDARREHLAMARLARVLLVEYIAYKREQGLADMSDLETCASSLLRDGALTGWIQERLDARYRHVLIDEFQDTSPLQWHALRAWLEGYVGAGGGASGQRPPSVFIVGDPKQSIYRFRRAEPRVFEAARGFVRDALGGVILECDHTRRNAPEIVAPLNAIFARASELGEFGAYRRHTTEIVPLAHAGILALPAVVRQRAGGATAPGAGAAWRDSLCTPRHSVEEVLREEEARHVGRAVQDLIRRHAVQPREIMVLCRKRQSLRLAAQALREVHVPFVAVEDHALLDAPEVRDLVAVLDVLVSTSHNLSLAQALRCPLFGASDADLMALAQPSSGHASWWTALLQEPPASAALRRAAELLRSWHADATRLPPHDLLDRIVHQGEYRERVAAAVPADQCPAALQAIDALLEQALTLDGARYATPYNFVRALKRRSIRVAAPARADAVQLLTVHGAKGLEARVVLIMDAQPEAAASRGPGVLVDWPVDADAPHCCAFLYSEARCPESLRDLLSAEVVARDREELNGLYVAMTRAKERLIVSATEPHRQAPGISWWRRVEAHAAAWVSHDGAWEPPRPASNPLRLKGLPLRERERLNELAPQAAASADEPGAARRRLGRGVHRFLEWATPNRGTVDDLSQFAGAAAREFGASADEVLDVGRAILHSEACARFFDSPELRWAGNEVPVSDADELLRIDRLVLFEAASGKVWWVLDYKLSHQPEELPAYRDQLLRYRDVVARLEPHCTVRCAFLTGRGQVIEMS
ncbi:MAG: UvrD-helicase domain-containing protein [Burkholderiaceae bacterium]